MNLEYDLILCSLNILVNMSNFSAGSPEIFFYIYFSEDILKF